MIVRYPPPSWPAELTRMESSWDDDESWIEEKRAPAWASYVVIAVLSALCWVPFGAVAYIGYLLWRG